MFGLDLVGNLVGGILGGGNRSQQVASTPQPPQATAEVDGKKFSGSEAFVEKMVAMSKDGFQSAVNSFANPTSLTPFSSSLSSATPETTSSGGSFVKLEEGTTATITKAATKPA